MKGVKRTLAGPIAAALACATLIVGFTSPVQANNWWGTTGNYGDCGYGNRADGNPMTFYYNDLTSEMTDAMEWVRTNQIGPTQITTSAPASSLDVFIDIVAFDRYYVDYCNQDWATSLQDDGVIGYTTCHAPSPSAKCEQHSVRYNNNVTDDSGTTLHRWLACHESGHAIGLRHRIPPSGGELGCMPGNPTGEGDYTAHDINHIDNDW